jgi:hypothetical protein
MRMKRTKHRGHCHEKYIQGGFIYKRDTNEIIGGNFEFIIPGSKPDIELLLFQLEFDPIIHNRP